jgi:hypothetical protein
MNKTYHKTEIALLLIISKLALRGFQMEETKTLQEKLHFEQNKVYARRNEAILKVMRDTTVPDIERMKLYLAVEETSYKEYLALYDLCEHDFHVKDKSWNHRDGYISRSCKRCGLRMEIGGEASRERPTDWSKARWMSSYHCVAYFSQWEYLVQKNIRDCCNHESGIYNSSHSESGPYYCKTCNALRPPPPGVYIDMWDPFYHPR